MITQFKYPGFERELLHENYECMNCLQPITNPLCHNCLGMQIASWMSLYPSVKKKMLPKLREYLKEVNNNTLSGVACTSCGKKAALCPYCFAEAVFNILKKSKIDRMVIMDFLSTFNFDSNHEGYIKDAIAEGLY